MITKRILLTIIFLIFLTTKVYSKYPIISLNIRKVKITAYNAHVSQTDSTPDICAWGDQIHDGVIAVSRDLEKLGLTRGKKVYIEGIGVKVIKDRMHYRKTNQIDIYMKSLSEAKKFGVQKLNIYWLDTDLTSKNLENNLEIIHALITSDF